ncbi:MAG TPA: non-homologous end-joining DNA ligase [Gaiellaceae bacterium]|nr:non-homologous end-joining DNA ligase [Gaiellaceae bacterium]
MSSVEVEGRRLALTNLDKVLWPESDFTKGDLITYYLEIAPVLLAHLAGRPVTTRRFPDGVDGVSWHQNECQGEPDWFPVFETTGRRGRPLRFCLVDGPASLLWLANRAAVELHPFLWRVELPRQPLSMVFDLDPGPPAGMLEAARSALRLRDLLEELGLAALVKTSGSLGLHLHVPLEQPGETKELARGIAQALAERHPDEVVAEMPLRLRAGKVFVDWLQNDPTRQTVAPYSLRGLPWSTVAAPLRWEEVEEAVAKERPERLTVLAQDVAGRLEEHGDLFEPLLALERELGLAR